MIYWIITLFHLTLATLNLFIVGGILLVISLINTPLIYPLASFFARFLLLSLGVWIRTEGSFPKCGQFIVMANHSSFIDPLILPAIMRGKFTGIVALYNYRYPVWAQILRRFKAIPIDRENTAKAIESMKYAEKVIKDSGYHVAILPEGTRTLTGKMGVFKKGGFHLAMNTKTAILPVGIEGAYRYKPKKARNTICPGIVTVRIGKPLEVQEFENLTMESLMDKTSNEIQKLSGEIKIVDDNNI